MGSKSQERTWTVTSSPQWFSDHGRFQITVKHQPRGVASGYLHGIKSEKDIEPLHFLGFAGEFGPQLTASGELRGTTAPHVVFLTAGIGVTPALAAAKQLELEPRPRSLTVMHSARALEETFLQTFMEQQQKLKELKVTLDQLLAPALLTALEAVYGRHGAEKGLEAPP